MPIERPSVMYESTVPQDTVLDLHHLCGPCSSLVRNSKLIQKLISGGSLRIRESEKIRLGSIEELKHGYLNGCHMCALLWIKARVHFYDPDGEYVRPGTLDEDVTLHLKAADEDKDYSMEHLSGTFQRWRLHNFPPNVGEMGHIRIMIMRKDTLGIDPEAFRSLYIVPSTFPGLNLRTLEHKRASVSSKHEKTLGQIADWVQNCIENHQKCNEFPDLVAPGGMLPTRLLDLRNGKVKLNCSPAQLGGIKYTTLSHMWGPDPSVYPSLKTDNLKDLEQHISEQALPVKYQDAIRISRSLGFNFIWIDSLCIIQDSSEDWENEALRMATVYGRSSCNISYTTPPADEHLQHHMRDPRIVLPCHLNSEAQHGCKTPATSVLVQHAVARMHLLFSATQFKNTWPLLSRAWVFQERLLCPRNVYYGHQRLIWECCEEVSDEFYGPGAAALRSKSAFYPIFKGVDNSGDKSKRVGAFKDQWNVLVSDYRLSALTFETDRAIALAGVVRAIQTNTKFTFLAGAWKEFAEFDLLWVRDNPDVGVKTDEKPQQNSTPSWSWFSVPPPAKGAEQDTVAFALSNQVFARSAYAAYRAQVVSFSHPKLATRPEALLYDFEGLSITVRARTSPATLRWEGGVIDVAPRDGYIWAETVWKEPKNAMQYFHDDAGTVSGCELPQDARMILLCEVAICARGGKELRYDAATDDGEVVRTTWMYAGLVITPSGHNELGQQEWKRIGVFIGNDEAAGYHDYTTPFKGREEEEVLLV